VKPEGARASKLRGGSWINNINNCRSACRNHNRFDAINNNIGFRLVVSARALQCRSRRVGIRRERQEESSARSGDALGASENQERRGGLVACEGEESRRLELRLNFPCR
jgi:hypothetical protein